MLLGILHDINLIDIIGFLTRSPKTHAAGTVTSCPQVGRSCRLWHGFRGSSWEVHTQPRATRLATIRQDRFTTVVLVRMVVGAQSWSGGEERKQRWWFCISGRSWPQTHTQTVIHRQEHAGWFRDVTSRAEPETSPTGVPAPGYGRYFE